MTPRGIRLHNPGNIRHGDPWQGLAPEQPDPEFCSFIAPEWGIRALARNLITYQDRHGLRTIRGIINRWAPPSGLRPDGTRYSQETLAYAEHVSSLTGFHVDESLDIHQHSYCRPLVEAIIRHENGQQPYPARVINRGLELAGIAPGHDPALDRPEGQGGAVLAGSAGAATLAGMIDQAAPALPVVSVLAQYAPWVIGLGLVIGLGWFVYCRWADNR